jgi:hypothetical protein
VATGTNRQDTPLAEPAANDRCGNCGAALATDQRYCLVCGERRGMSRFAAPSTVTLPTSDTQATSPVSPSLARSRFNPATTLVGGVATLLIAMGVGVLIGENGAGSARNLAAASPQVITVDGAGQSSAGSGGSGSSNSARNTKSSSRASKHRSSSHASARSGSTVVHVTKKVETQMTTALNSVVGTSAHTVAPTTKLGGQCQSGQSGCQSGKFTGNFFGGG